MSEEKQTIKKYIKYIIIFPLILLLFMILMIRKTIDKREFKETHFYQYIGGQKIEYNGKIVLDKNENISELKFEDVTVELDSTPIYYESEDKLKVIFPETMNVVYPESNGLQYKTPYFTTLESNGSWIQSDKGKTFENCFIFDFKNLYFFIDNTVLKVGETEYELEPFSYTIVDENMIEIYDKKNNEYYIIEPNENVYATSNGYTIDLNIDSIKYGENERILIRNEDFLKNIN